MPDALRVKIVRAAPLTETISAMNASACMIILGFNLVTKLSFKLFYFAPSFRNGGHRGAVPSVS